MKPVLRLVDSGYGLLAFFGLSGARAVNKKMGIDSRSTVAMDTSPHETIQLVEINDKSTTWGVRVSYRGKLISFTLQKAMN
jgi:hypothetical protein